MMSGGQSCTFPHDHPEQDRGWPVRTRVARAFTAGLVISALLIYLAWGFVAIVHADDRYHVGWAEGSRIALARSAAGGVLYPPLYDGHFYGATRFMPVPIVLHAGLARLTGDYLVSGKLLAYLSSALLLAAMFVVLRRAACPIAAALALTAGVLVTLPGLLAATTVQGDALPVVLQIAAVALMQRSQRPVATIGSAGLCALAILTKLTAVWAPLAIGVWLLLRDRRRLRLFAPPLLLLLAAEVVLCQALSDGRMLTNLREVAFAGVGGASGFVQSPMRVLSLVADGAPIVLILVPFAFVGVVMRGRQGISIWLISLLCALVVLLVVMADTGALYNHLLDLVVLTLIVAGELWAAFEPSPCRMSVIGVTLTMVVIWGLASSFLLEVRPDLEEAAREIVGGTPARYDPHPLAHEIAPGDTLLSEDPYVAVSLGRRPVVLDAWTLLRIGRKHPVWTSDLAERIEARQFDRIVLVYPISFEGWYSQTHFGAPIADAIRTSYRFGERRDGYYVYVPARRATPAQTAS
jgi:hypothetical protein